MIFTKGLSIISIIIINTDDIIFCACGHSRIYEYNLKKKIQTKIYEGHTIAVNCISMIKDRNRFVSAAEDIRVWNITMNCIEFIIAGHKRPITCIDISYDDNFIVSGSSGHIVQV